MPGLLSIGTKLIVLPSRKQPLMWCCDRLRDISRRIREPVIDRLGTVGRLLRSGDRCGGFQRVENRSAKPISVSDRHFFEFFLSGSIQIRDPSGSAWHWSTHRL